MKRLAFIIGTIFAGTLLAEAALPTLLPLLVGTPVTLDTGVPQPTSSGGCRQYGTAYNTIDEEYMVAWHTETVAGVEVRVRRLDIDGVPLAPAVFLGGGFMDLTNPQISYSPLANEYLLVYEEYTVNIAGGPHWVYAQRLDAFGNKIGTAQNVGSGPGEKKEPHVAWDGSRWLVVWRDEMTIGINPTATNAIYGQFVDSDGKLAGTEFELGTPGSINNKPPRVAYNAASDNFLVVAQLVDNATFMGFLVDGVSGAMTSKFQVAKPEEMAKAFPDVAADPDLANPRFLVSWGIWDLNNSSVTGLDFEIQGQFVRADGTLDGTMVMLEEASGGAILEIFSSLTFSPETQEYMLAYEFYLDQNLPLEYRVNRLDKNGAVLESEIIVSGPVSGSLVQPTIGAGFGGRFIMMWQSEGDLSAQVYESPNYNPNGGSVNPGTEPGTGSNHENSNGDHAINDTLCAGSAVNGSWGRLLGPILLFGFLLLLAGRFGARRTLDTRSPRR